MRACVPACLRACVYIWLATVTLNPTLTVLPDFLALTTTAFRPQSKEHLQDAVDKCIKMSPIGHCSKGLHGSIRNWDVSAITDMRGLVYSASYFNRDLSKWDVSAVTAMTVMFSDASAFNQDLSKWDVSAVTDMRSMFHGASAFKHELCGFAWVNSKARKIDMFTDSQGLISSTVCTTARTGYCEGEGYG